MGIIGIIILLAVAVLGVAVVYAVSGGKRVCPYCHSMMSKKTTQCPHCHKAVPLGY